MDNEVAEARAKLAARFGKVQLGGKGTSISHGRSLGSARSLALAEHRRSYAVFYRDRHPEKSSEEDASQLAGRCHRGQEAQGSHQEVW